MGKNKSSRYKDNEKYDEHHILYQGKHWGGNPGAWSAKLRNCSYYRRLVPTDSLHREIHSKVHDIPVPSGKICRTVYEKTRLALYDGIIDDTYDTLEKRIDFLIECLKDFPEEDVIATIIMLHEQRKVISRFCAKNR